MSPLDLIDTWREITAPRFAPLLAQLVEFGGARIDPALVTRLRAQFTADEVSVALELDAARRRAQVKFPQAATLLCDVEGVAQASGAVIAAHKAARFAGADRIVDLCCGIGGDTMALAALGVELIGVDASPTRALMASHNAGVPVTVAELTQVPIDGASIHIDPGRRHGKRRLWRYADLLPGPELVEPLLDAAPGAALKLGPGVDWTEVPRREERECEVIGDRSGLLQAVIWCGALAQHPGQHTATRLSDGLSFSARPGGNPMVALAPGRFLLIPDPALERARLVAARLGDAAVEELAAGLGWLTSDQQLGDPWFEEHEILANMAWRPRRIRDWLAAHDGGLITVRTRAAAVNTDREQLALRGTGATPYTVFGVREGKRVVCYIAAAARENR